MMARTEKGLSLAALLLICVILASLVSGCAVLHRSRTDWEIHPVSKAGAEVQTITYKRKGVSVVGSDPTANGLPAIHIGVEEVIVTRVPGFPTDVAVPSVQSGGEIDAETGARVNDMFAIGALVNTGTPLDAPEDEHTEEEP